ncbi:MAG: c-type cytochrome [Chitinophagaceae bacterium]
MVTASCRFYFNTTKDQITTTKSTTSFERGKNLAFNMCSGCHYDQKAKKFIGKKLGSLPKIAGQLYTSNLTNSPTNGIPPAYTDAELFYLMKTGIAKNGRFMPYMMRPMMADEDINDLIVYLRSGDDPVADGNTTIGKTHINLIGKTGIRLALKPTPYTKNVARPSEDDPIAYGRYLVAIIGCYHCHSSKMTGVDFLTPEKSKGYLQGGIKFKNPEGHRIRGTNLTPDPETGIGAFSQEDFRTAVRDGVTPSGRKLSPPMDKFKELTDKQVDAIFAYLKSLPPVNHKVEN